MLKAFGIDTKALVTQIRAMAFLILSSLKRNPVLKGLSKALYLSTASTVRVMEGTIAKVVMRPMPRKPSARNFHHLHID